MHKIAVLVSGGGTNLQAIIDEVELGNIPCKIECVISDRQGAYGIERAKKHGIDTYIVDRKIHKGNVSDEILKIVDGKVDTIVLAGFLSIIKGDMISKFKNRIINIHPSLLPLFGGKGMYGIKVHEAAIEQGVRKSGCTVHLVDEGTDTGAIILQRAVEVNEWDSPEDLQQKVLKEEYKALPQVVKWMAEEKVLVDGRSVVIK